jgi:signal transduction histidine kinase
MSLRVKLVAAFACVTLVLILPSVFAARQLQNLRDLAVDGRSGHAAAVAGIGRMHALISELDRIERSFVATADPTLHHAAVAAIDSLRQAAGRLQVPELSAAVEQAAAAALHIVDLMSEGRVDDATEAYGPLMTEFRRIDDELVSAADAVDARAREDAARADVMSRTASIQTLFGIGVALLLTLIVASLTTHTITNPLRKLARGMAQVADGGFEAPIGLPYGRKDEIGEVSNSFAVMARRLSEMDRTKSEFFGVVSHELKTPLNVIGAYAEMLQEELRGERSEHRRSLLREITDQCSVMLKRVCRLMDISRIAAGTFELAPERIGTEELLTSLRKAWSERAREKNVTFSVTVTGPIPEYTVMDVDIIRDEVLGNLIVNALRFTPAGGRIDVDVGACEGGVVFTVTDTGPGIAEEHRDLVFQKHYVIDRRSAVGSGLGLAIAKEMVGLHGGLITLEPPQAGRGARFVVSLPRFAASPELEVPGSEIIEANAAGSFHPLPERYVSETPALEARLSEA